MSTHRRARRNRTGRQAGFTLIELVISIAILGAIGGSLVTVFAVSLRNSDTAQTKLAGPRAANSLAMRLTSDISSATPVDPALWLNADPTAEVGCDVDAGGSTNILRIETRNPDAHEQTYVASYRYRPPATGAITGWIERVSCRTGRAPTDNDVLSRDVDPTTAPTATISPAADSVQMSLTIQAKDQRYPIVLSAAIRSQDEAPLLDPGVTTTRPTRGGCMYTDGFIETGVRRRGGLSPLREPVNVTVVTNASAGGRCTAIALRITNPETTCELTQQSDRDRWSGSCFGPATGVQLPAEFATFPIVVVDRTAVDGSGDIAIAGSPPLKLQVRTSLTIDGTVFDDVNYGGGEGRSLERALAAGGSRRPDARVELYDVQDRTAVFIDSVTTDGDGRYRFDGPSCQSCAVRVVVSSVTSDRKGSTTDLRAVPTFLTHATGGAIAPRTDMVGGILPSALDGPEGRDTTFDVETGEMNGGPEVAQVFSLVDDAIGEANSREHSRRWARLASPSDHQRQHVAQRHRAGGLGPIERRGARCLDAARSGVHRR
jgi:prepilin-type N-terminal cleavage/methylation domain-containing protein